MDTTSRKPRAERREEIARAALEILGARGLGGLTTTALAEAIGVTSGALFRHFASRDEILEEAVRLAALDVEATIPDAALPPMERLRVLAVGRVRLISREPGIAWLLRSGQATQALPPAAVKRLRSLVRRSRSYIRTTLDEAVAAGDVRADVGRDVLLLVFTATVHALIGSRGLGAKRTGRAAQDSSIDGLMALLAGPPDPTPRS